MPTAPAQNVAVQSATATQLDVTWDPPPLEAQNGDIQGYKVPAAFITVPELHLFILNEKEQYDSATSSFNLFSS